VLNLAIGGPDCYFPILPSNRLREPASEAQALIRISQI
jgi:hypothetical protein